MPPCHMTHKVMKNKKQYFRMLKHCITNPHKKTPNKQPLKNKK